MTYCEVTHTEKSSFRALWFMFCHEGAIEFSGKVEHRGGSYLSDLIDEKYSTQQFQFRLSDYLQVLCRPTVRVRVCVWACVCACVCACTMACACNKHLRGEVKARKENQWEKKRKPIEETKPFVALCLCSQHSLQHLVEMPLPAHRIVFLPSPLVAAAGKGVCETVLSPHLVSC